VYTTRARRRCVRADRVACLLLCAIGMQQHFILIACLAGCDLVRAHAQPAAEPLDRRTDRDSFVSTKETAAKLNGLPGLPCAEEDRGGVEGPCWDPPGFDRQVPMAHLQPGMRVIEAPDWRHTAPDAMYWFDMPKEAKEEGRTGKAMLPDTAGAVTAYTPYAKQGFVRPPLPAMTGRPIGDVLADLDKLDMPFSVFVRYRECDAPHDIICSAEDREEHFKVMVSMKIRRRGLPDEERLMPKKATLEGRPPADVKAELEKIGFTNVQIVAKDLPCKRGIVCSMPGNDGGWHETNGLVELWVRAAAVD